ncbi:hypothetical protein LTR17_023965 [Elasticomyces elasticus]|nr:hypothetical protein LTR17_023965 [Elasticomyces elasticus]
MAVIKLKFRPADVEQVLDIPARDWKEPPPFKDYYTSEQLLVYLIRLFTKNGLDAALEKIPGDTGLIRVNIPQYERVRGGKVIAVLGMCPHKGAEFDLDDPD